jgi:hypothetical protein
MHLPLVTRTPRPASEPMVASGDGRRERESTGARNDKNRGLRKDSPVIRKEARRWLRRSANTQWQIEGGEPVGKAPYLCAIGLRFLE